MPNAQCPMPRVMSCAVVAGLCLLSISSFAQPGSPPRVSQRGGVEGRGGQAAFDPKDLSGYWLRNAVRLRNGPPLTAAAIEAMKGRIPIPKVRVPSESNDPMYACNPQGFPRLIWEENEPIEIIVLPDRVLQLFQWERTLRELWLDGRELPRGERLENLGPAWYGHSVARWEGNTLVVQTTGVDERAWLNDDGHPKSFDAIYEERYTRTGTDTIQGQLTINDPKVFTKPWVVPASTFRRMAEDDIVFFGWRGLFSGVTEAICAPMNEVDDFNRRMRDPAARGK
jgi:hypothetical protein